MTDWPSIVRENSAAVWRTAYRLLGDHTDAADCVQDTFIRALDVARRQPVRHWPALLCRLATARALDRLRQRARHQGRHESLPDIAAVACGNPGPVENLQVLELAGCLRQVLGQLPSDQAQAFCLRFLENQSYRQIAEQMGINTSAVGVLLHRARRQLQKELGSAFAEKEI